MILVITEHREGKLTSISNELIVFAQRAGRDLAVPVAAAVIGDAGAGLDALKSAMIDRIVTVEDARLNVYDPDGYVAAIRAILSRHTPSLIVAGHTTQGMDFMPRLAVALRKPLVSGCVSYEKAGDGMVLTRLVFNAKMNLKVAPRGDGPYLATLVPGSFPGDEVETGGSPEIEAVPADLSQVPTRRRRISQSQAPRGTVDLGSAAVI